MTTTIELRLSDTDGRPIVWCAQVKFSGPRTALRFGSRLLVGVFERHGTFSPHLYLCLGDEPWLPNCCTFDAEDAAAVTETDRILPLTRDLDDGTIEFIVPGDFQQVLSANYSMPRANREPNRPKPVDDDDRPSRAVLRLPVAATHVWSDEEDGADETDTQDTDDELEGEPVDLEALDKSALVELALELDIEVTSRMTADALRTAIERACSEEAV